MSLISQKAIDLIVDQEVSGKAAYIRSYQRPTWPGGASGVTVGIGYDCGYSDRAKIASDWKALSPAMIKVLQGCAGVTGGSAHALTQRVRGSVVIGWDDAMAEFLNVEIPQWYLRCSKVLPNMDMLSPDCIGALVSLAYNRGAGGFTMAGDRFKEMRAIRAAMIKKDFAAIPAQFVAMRRLWVGRGLDGLLSRRSIEAAMFKAGLNKQPAAVPAPPTAPDQPHITQASPAPEAIPAAPAAQPVTEPASQPANTPILTSIINKVLGR